MIAATATATVSVTANANVTGVSESVTVHEMTEETSETPAIIATRENLVGPESPEVCVRVDGTTADSILLAPKDLEEIGDRISALIAVPSALRSRESKSRL